MRNIEDLDFNEIAATLEITPETARKRYGRALLRLIRFGRFAMRSNASAIIFRTRTTLKGWIFWKGKLTELTQKFSR